MDDGGFTLVEVLVAATLLVIGALATLALLDNGAAATVSSKQRDVANALAQEVVERSVGGRYTATRNDLTDVDPSAAAAVAGPADRLRLALDPDGDQASTAVTPTTITTGKVPLAEPQSWTVRRQGTTYTVSYRACTSSEVYQGVQILGPYDCSRSSTPPGLEDQKPISPSCDLGVVAGTGVPAPDDPTPVTVQLQLLGLVGVEACVGALSDPLSDALCDLLGSSPLLDGLTNVLLGADGLLSNLLGNLNSIAALTFCPVAQVDTALTGAYAGIASSTRVAVTVGWTSLSGQPQSIERATIVRRPTS